VLDLSQDAPHQLKWRTNGAGLPGYSAGWFTLRDGEKSLAFVTDRHRVLYLPTREGYALMVSLLEPDRFLVALRRVSGQALAGGS
jgi:hypothetical protein